MHCNDYDSRAGEDLLPQGHMPWHARSHVCFTLQNTAGVTSTIGRIPPTPTLPK